MSVDIRSVNGEEDAGGVLVSAANSVLILRTGPGCSSEGRTSKGFSSSSSSSFSSSSSSSSSSS
ncbi:MAG: hypothetical protein Q8P67_06220, partial [archaeon]|nr:hypothetical protein [archaeon]